LGRYGLTGKIEEPITEAEFSKGMKSGHFVEDKHRAFCVLLYYAGVRRGEALRVTRDQFRFTDSAIMYNVGERLKHSKETPNLKLPYSAPYMMELQKTIEDTKPGEKVFRFCPKTAYNIVHRVWKYPHLFRLTRITSFFQQGYTIAQLRSWTGLSLAALEYYVGIVDTQKMGDSLAKPNRCAKTPDLDISV
jgi:integrase